jgi:hypothetical protein
MPQDLQVIQQWLERADADLRVASLVQADSSLSAEIGFHCQQALRRPSKLTSRFTLSNSIGHTTSTICFGCVGTKTLRSLNSSRPPHG